MCWACDFFLSSVQRLEGSVNIIMETQKTKNPIWRGDNVNQLQTHLSLHAHTSQQKSFSLSGSS